GMNNAGQNGEKISYRVILLLVVGLTAFSSAMKELNQVQQLSLDASRLIAQWSDKLAPPAVPQTPVKVESCELKQSPPSAELPWLTTVADEETTEPPAAEPGEPGLTRQAKPRAERIGKLKKLRRLNIDP